MTTEEATRKPIAWQFRMTREDGSWSDWQFWRGSDKPEIQALEWREAEYRPLYLGIEDANRELPRVWRTAGVPCWPDGLTHHFEKDAVDHLRKHGNEFSTLRSWVPNYDARSYTAEEIRALIGATA